MLKFSALIALSAGLLGLLPWQSASAQVFEDIELIIDDFVTEQSGAATGVVGSPSSLVGNFANTETAIGIERDLFLQKTNGNTPNTSATLDVQINPFGEDLLRMVNGQNRGRVFVVWDGIDNAPNPVSPNLPGSVTPQVNFDGLEGIDFSIFDALEFSIAFSDVGGLVNFTFWDGDDATGASFARTSVRIPANIEVDPPQLFSIDFNETNFTLTNALSLTEVLDSVGAIQMEIDATNTEFSPTSGWDLNLDIIRVVGQREVPEPPSVPEPSTILSLLALGALPLSKKLKNSKKQS